MSRVFIGLTLGIVISLFGNEICLGDNRQYTISLTTGAGQSDETTTPVYFRLINDNDDTTDWFKYDSFPSRDTQYTFTRCLNDIGEIKQIEMIRKDADHIVPAAVSVDNLNYTFNPEIALGCCCWQMIVDFELQTQIRTQFPSSSTYCDDVDSNIIARPNCTTNSPSLMPSNTPTIRPTLIPTSTPSVAPVSPSSCEYTHKCKAWGDPHINTFDGTYYHFQGDGYFDYVTSCNSPDSVPLPFTISALHTKCRNQFTCVSQVVISLTDSFNDITTVTIESDGNSNVGIGTYIFTDINGYEASYIVSKNNNGFGVVEIFFIYDDGTATPSNIKIKYKNTKMVIYGSDCLYGNYNKCGLCGNINNNTIDDFIRCDDNSLISTDNSNSYNEPTWSRVHEFGESCCNSELDLEYLGETDCDLDNNNNGTVPEPCKESCMEDARVICNEMYEKYCKDCTHSNDLVDDVFLDSCAMDVCATCSDNNGEINVFSVEEAKDNGCLDTSIYECVWEKLDQIDDILF